MKKNKLVLSTLTIALGATLIAPNALAASQSTTSKGEAGFTVPSGNIDNEIQIPEVVPEVTVKPPYTGGNNEAQLTGIALFVPDFNFGTKEIKQEEQIFNVKPVKYTNTDTSATVQDYYLPPMVIVKDQRGEHGTWEINVSASKFMNGTDELKGTQFIINDRQLFNSGKSVAGALPTISDQNVTDSDKFLIFPGKGTVTASSFEFKEDSQVFMKSKGIEGLFQTTLVPDTPANYDDLKAKKGVKYTATSEIPSVQLVVPAASVRKVGTYTSTITWELTATP